MDDDGFDEAETEQDEGLEDELIADIRELYRVVGRCTCDGKRIRLPKEFARSFGGRFTHCLTCGAPLVDNGRKEFSFLRMRSVAKPYCIVKETRRGEPWVEYAICLDCVDLVDACSVRTVAAFVRLFLAHADLQARFTRRIGTRRLRDWLARCVLTGDRIDPQGTYRLIAYCEGGRLVLSALPIAIGERGMAMFAACWSAGSAQVRDGFMRRHLGVDAVV